MRTAGSVIRNRTGRIQNKVLKTPDDRRVAKRWCLTINNPTEMDIELIKTREVPGPVWNYIVAELEHTGEGEGTPHVQMYCEMVSKCRLKFFKNTWPTAHCEIAKGGRVENILYCTKEATAGRPENLIVGNIEDAYYKDASHRVADIKATQLLFDMRNMTETEFEAAHPTYYLNHQERVQKFRHEALTKVQNTYNGNLKSKNLWIWGPAGVGKSRLARTSIDMNLVYEKPLNKWWDGFDQDSIKRVIIEDWPDKDNGGNMLSQHLKIWADRYAFTAEVKGSAKRISPKYNLVITSNYSIEECFSNDRDIDAIIRRFTSFHMTGEEGTLDQFIELQ